MTAAREVRVPVRDAIVSVRTFDFDRPDLALVAFIDGSWAPFERSVAAGLACEHQSGNAADAQAIRAGAVSFRRARGLLAGDELEAWLAQHNMSRGEWTGYLRRRVLRDRADDAMAGILTEHPVSLGDVAQILDVEAACDGILQRCGNTVVGWAAAAHSEGLGAVTPTIDANAARALAIAAQVNSSAVSTLFDLAGEDLLRRINRLLSLHAAYKCFVQRVTSDAAIRECLAVHQLDWLGVCCVDLSFANQDAAYEGAMCLREDGLDPNEVARLAGANRVDRMIVLDEAAPELASLLVSAQTGDVIGPLPIDAGRSRLLVVVDRLPPSPTDPVLRERARNELAAAALEPLTAGMVRWHAAL